jgi:hypothetical protein
MSHYISFDVEADGPLPGINNCLSLGCVLFSCEADHFVCLDRKEFCFKSQEGAAPNSKTMETFWSQHMEEYNRIELNAEESGVAVNKFISWYTDIVQKYGKVKFVAKPAAFDWQFINHMVHRYKKEEINFPFKADCMSTLMDFADEYCKKHGKEKEYKELLNHPTLKLTHTAVEDAEYQAFLFFQTKKFLSNI